MKQGKKNKNAQNEQVIWSNAEEEIFDEVVFLVMRLFYISIEILIEHKCVCFVFQEAEYKFEFCVQNEKGSGMSGSWDEGDCEMIPYRRVLLFPTKKLDSIINKIQALLNSSQ